MQIKRIKLSGFKSFVEPADLRIEPGLTGVVGPNGCGKSNVLEAIRWVMGESSPKSMRGSGMEDVIFAGTASRAARDFAEVSLLVDGAAVAEGEVEVTRRIERGAGSAYRINGRDVRAKDVALLFADAATGAHSPALVSQNRIGAIIAARPTERRQMLEEAAGIAGLHVRRKDAEQKLRAAEANLTRLDELLGDMEQRAASLKRQARSAERYRKLSDDIRVAEARLIFARWREAAGAAEKAKAEADAAVATVERAAEGQRAAAAYQAQATQLLAERRKAALLAREEATGLGHRLASLRTERDQVGRRIDELASRRAALTTDRAREAALRDDAEAALARLAEEIGSIERRILAVEQARSTVDARSIALEDAARAAESALGRARAEQAGEQAEARVAAAARDQAQARLARAEQERARLAVELAQLGDLLPLTAQRLAARERREDAALALEAASARIAAAEAARQSATGERDTAESDAAAARAVLSALQAEERALAKAVEKTGSGKVLDAVKAAPGFERALAASLGDDLEAGLGEGPRRWTGAEIGRDDPALPPGCTSLAAQVEAPLALRKRLTQVGVVDEDDGSIPLAVGQRLVTTSGRMRRWDGFVSEGQGTAAAERLIRLNRLNEIERALPGAEASVAAAQARIDTAVSTLETARAAMQAARGAEAEAAAAIRQAERDEDAANVAIERLDLKRSGLAERMNLADADLSEARDALLAAEKVAAALPDSAATEARVAALRTEAERANGALADVRAEAATHARSLAADRQRIEAARKEHADWTARAREAEQRHGDMGNRIAEAEAEAAQLAEAPERLEKEVVRLDGAYSGAREAADAAMAAEREAETALREAEQRLADTGEALSVAREARAGAIARHENHETRRVEMGRISGERFECPPPVLPGKVGFDAESIRAVGDESADLERLTVDRERIGPVNLIAEQELAELEEGRTSSAAEREELGLAINRLRGSIGSLNREGRARLLAAFEAVNGHFQSLFSTLFEGGAAHLELVESDDPLEAGLEIMAQPPGKKLSTLTLLSGGEQALTAVALIFALFLTNPAPICVLDEVDAPLDDANIERFCDLLDRMVRETDTRYLIVTHNAVTMSRMHRLFGVTMIERGVSRLVSVDLGGAEKLLAAE